MLINIFMGWVKTFSPAGRLIIEKHLITNKKTHDYYEHCSATRNQGG